MGYLDVPGDSLCLGDTILKTSFIYVFWFHDNQATFQWTTQLPSYSVLGKRQLRWERQACGTPDTDVPRNKWVNWPFGLAVHLRWWSQHVSLSPSVWLRLRLLIRVRGWVGTGRGPDSGLGLIHQSDTMLGNTWPIANGLFPSDIPVLP